MVGQLLQPLNTRFQTVTVTPGGSARLTVLRASRKVAALQTGAIAKVGGSTMLPVVASCRSFAHALLVRRLTRPMMLLAAAGRPAQTRRACSRPLRRAPRSSHLPSAVAPAARRRRPAAAAATATLQALWTPWRCHPRPQLPPLLLSRRESRPLAGRRVQQLLRPHRSRSAMAAAPLAPRRRWRSHGGAAALAPRPPRHRRCRRCSHQSRWEQQQDPWLAAMS